MCQIKIGEKRLFMGFSYPHILTVSIMHTINSLYLILSWYMETYRQYYLCSLIISEERNGDYYLFCTIIESESPSQSPGTFLLAVPESFTTEMILSGTNSDS